MTTDQTAFPGIVRRNPPASPKAACLAALAFAGIATTGIAAANPPPPSQPSAESVTYPPYAIDPVDVHAATLSDQPNITGIGVMIGPDGHPHVFCVDPSETGQASRLRMDMQIGADTVRYK